MKKIYLTGKYGSVIGNFAIVDDHIYNVIIKYKWRAMEVKYINSVKYYAMTSINRKHFMMHRFILNISDSKIGIDHIDENGLNNQLANLRIATKSLKTLQMFLKENNI